MIGCFALFFRFPNDTQIKLDGRSSKQKVLALSFIGSSASDFCFVKLLTLKILPPGTATANFLERMRRNDIDHKSMNFKIYLDLYSGWTNW